MWIVNYYYGRRIETVRYRNKLEALKAIKTIVFDSKECISFSCHKAGWSEELESILNGKQSDDNYILK